MKFPLFNKCEVGVHVERCEIIHLSNFMNLSVADPGFPVWGAALGGGGAPMSDAAKTYTKAKELGPVGGGRERIICEKKGIFESELEAERKLGVLCIPS